MLLIEPRQETEFWKRVMTLVRRNQIAVANKKIQGHLMMTFIALGYSPSVVRRRVIIRVKSIQDVQTLMDQHLKVAERLREGGRENALREFVKIVKFLPSVSPSTSEVDLFVDLLDSKKGEVKLVFKGGNGTQKPRLQRKIKSLSRTSVELYQAGEAAKILGVSPQTIRRYCEEGRYPEATKTPGGHWRIPAMYFRMTPRQAERAEATMSELHRKADDAGIAEDPYV